MKRLLALVTVWLALATPLAWATQRTYRVERGDTLEKIAKKFYGRSSDWRRIATANGITDPRRLRAGMTIVVPYRPDEQPPRERPTASPSPGPTAAPPRERDVPPPGERGAPAPRPPSPQPAPEPSVAPAPRPTPRRDPPPPEASGPPVELELDQVTVIAGQSAGSSQGLNWGHLVIGAIALVALILLEVWCLGYTARAFGVEAARGGRCTGVALVLDSFAVLGALFGASIVTALGVAADGPFAAVIVGVIVVVFLWAAFWIASRILAVGFGRALFLLTVALVFFAVAALLAWGILLAIASVARTILRT